MARQAAECALAWWLATKDRLLSLLPNGGADANDGADVEVRRDAVRRWEIGLAPLFTTLLLCVKTRFS
jgi:hypothetical protein